jgi:hypothetical protein
MVMHCLQAEGILLRPSNLHELKPEFKLDVHVDASARMNFQSGFVKLLGKSGLSLGGLNVKAKLCFQDADYRLMLYAGILENRPYHHFEAQLGALGVFMGSMDLSVGLSAGELAQIFPTRLGLNKPHYQAVGGAHDPVLVANTNVAFDGTIVVVVKPTLGYRAQLVFGDRQLMDMAVSN